MNDIVNINISDCTGHNSLYALTIHTEDEVLCRLLFIRLSFLIWSLCCLSFCDIWILNTRFVTSIPLWFPLLLSLEKRAKLWVKCSSLGFPFTYFFAWYNRYMQNVQTEFDNGGLSTVNYWNRNPILQEQLSYPFGENQYIIYLWKLKKTIAPR